MKRPVEGRGEKYSSVKGGFGNELQRHFLFGLSEAHEEWLFWVIKKKSRRIVDETKEGERVPRDVKRKIDEFPHLEEGYGTKE